MGYNVSSKPKFLFVVKRNFYCLQQLCNLKHPKYLVLFWIVTSYLFNYFTYSSCMIWTKLSIFCMRIYQRRSTWLQELLRSTNTQKCNRCWGKHSSVLLFRFPWQCKGEMVYWWYPDLRIWKIQNWRKWPREETFNSP